MRAPHYRGLRVYRLGMDVDMKITDIICFYLF